MFDELYRPKPGDGAPFGGRYRPPAAFPHGERTLVAEYPQEGDGQPVRVYETRHPATAFEIAALPGADSGGEPQAGFTLSTGSGYRMRELAARLAEAIAAGMLGLRRD